MAHIKLQNENLPGISGLLYHSPETAKPLSQLAETILRGPSTLSMAERELIASYVSWLNQCVFCHLSHGAAALAHLNLDTSHVAKIQAGCKGLDVSHKFFALLRIAEQVQQSGKNVNAETVDAARKLGATDMEIHHTVLIAAAFCMYNRYVDGLGTFTSANPADFQATGERLAMHGYVRPTS